MTLEDNIKVLSRYLEDNGIIDKKFSLIPLRKYTTNRTFKVYKTFEITLWLVNINTNEKKCILMSVVPRKILSENDEKIAIKEIEEEFIYKLYSTIDDNKIKELLYGE